MTRTPGGTVQGTRQPTEKASVVSVCGKGNGVAEVDGVSVPVELRDAVVVDDCDDVELAEVDADADDVALRVGVCDKVADAVSDAVDAGMPHAAYSHELQLSGWNAPATQQSQHSEKDAFTAHAAQYAGTAVACGTMDAAGDGDGGGGGITNSAVSCVATRPTSAGVSGYPYTIKAPTSPSLHSPNQEPPRDSREGPTP